MKTSLPTRLALAVLAVCLFDFRASAQIYINEVMADNATAFDVDGEFPDYVELINIGSTTNNISGFYLSVDATKRDDHNATYRFPANSFIPPGGFLVVICDGNTNQRYHTRFNIGKLGETLSLHGAQFGVRDAVRFGFQVTDHSMARVPDATNGTWVLCEPTPGNFNVQTAIGSRGRLRFNEWAPSRGTANDWFELYNSDTRPVSIGGLVFTDRSTNSTILTNSWIAAGAFIEFQCDDEPQDGIDHLPFKLTSSGMANSPPEWLRLYVTNITLRTFNIIHEAFWTNAVLGESYGWLPDGNTNDPVVTFPVNRDTPGDSNFLPIDNVLINEILAHTDLPLEDAIELYNPTETAVDISGWWLSDDKDVYNKFRIPDATIIPPHGYVVYYEYLGQPGGFNPNGQGTFPSFSLSSSQGDQVYLYQTYPGTTKLNGYRRGVDFPASANGVSYGRYITSTGESDFIPLETLTFGSNVTASDPPDRINQFRAGTGATNSGPLFGPLVISEIMYHPPDFIENVTNLVQNEIDEYVEIYNPTLQTVKLWDTNVYQYPPFGYVYTNTWRLRGGIDFNFPTNVSLAPGKSLIVVNFGLTNILQLNRFRGLFRIPPDVPIFGAYGGSLSDGGETFQIERPDPPQPPGRPDTGFVPYVRVDKVRYDDDPPFPAEPDGVRIDVNNPNSVGYCLVRIKPEEYGGDVINWAAAHPSPGYQIIWNSVSRVGNQVTIAFNGLAGSGYTVQYKDGLEQGSWQKLQDFAPQSTTGQRQVVVSVANGSKRFYQVVTPIQP